MARRTDQDKMNEVIDTVPVRESPAFDRRWIEAYEPADRDYTAPRYNHNPLWRYRRFLNTRTITLLQQLVVDEYDIYKQVCNEVR